MKTKLKTDRTYKFIEHKNKVVIYGKVGASMLSDRVDAIEHYEINLTQSYNEWLLSDFNITHVITIEPTPNRILHYYDICKKVKTISNYINVKYIGNKFNKFKNKKDTFIFSVVKETQQNEHYNILVHNPFQNLPEKNHTRIDYEYIMKNLLNDFISCWHKRFNRNQKIYADAQTLGVVQDKMRCVNYQHKKLNMSSQEDKTYAMI